MCFVRLAWLVCLDDRAYFACFAGGCDEVSFPACFSLLPPRKMVPQDKNSIRFAGRAMIAYFMDGVEAEYFHVLME